MGVFFNVAYRIGLPNGRIHVVLNRADARSGIDAAEIEKSFKRKVEYRIPSGGLAPTLSVNRGEPLAIKNPNHPISQVFYKMAESLQMPVLVKKG
jgi:MinD-like ATPase involved in chromosome partitioning or flagellar assembly